ncbi:MAG: GntR family transcriptional regulator [Spirochaetales bacterium]|nr:GntR family transcriptional regulator [Spirochaetales bacterium]
MNRKNLSELMAEGVREAILAGAWKAGDALPTEPELADRYGVSRAVVRDGTRLLAAWGLVESRQGKGVFVTQNQDEGFAEALLLALRRNGASVWDVESAEAHLLPEAVAMAAKRSGQIHFEDLELLRDEYLMALEQANRDGDGRGFRLPWLALVDALYRASGNAVFQILGPAVARSRQHRHFEDLEEMSVDEQVERERKILNQILDGIRSGNEDEAREIAQRVMSLGEEAQQLLITFPVGEVPRIPTELLIHKR